MTSFSRNSLFVRSSAVFFLSFQVVFFLSEFRVTAKSKRCHYQGWQNDRPRLCSSFFLQGRYDEDYLNLM